MDKVKRLVDALNEKNADWKTELDFYEKGEKENIDNSRSKLYDELFYELKQFIKKHIEEKNNEALNGMKEELEVLIDKQEIVSKVLNIAANSLLIYKSLKTLRKWERNSIEITKGRINIIFDNYIERIDTQFINKYHEYDVDSVNEFQRMLNVLESVTEYYVVRHYEKNSIIQDFRDESGVGVEIAEELASQIEKRYNSLQMNFLMERMARLELKVMDME